MIKRARFSGGSRVGRSSHRSWQLAAIGGALATALLSCQTTASLSPTAQLHIRNVDGPSATVFVAGVQLATVPCGESVTVMPRQSPPWEVLVVDVAGSELLRETLSDAPEQGVLIRSDGVIAGPWPLPGGPAPATSCPPE